jgi:HSP20 family protein
MSQLDVKKVVAPDDKSLPIFAEFEQLAERIRLQAYNLFAHRGAGDGRALDDWLAAERQLCWPAAELTERNGEYVLNVALAGFEPAEIEVTATPSEIMIKGGHKSEQSAGDDESKVRWSELRSRSAFRRVGLPTTVDVEKISASLENGLLKIVAPKARAEGKAAKQVQISTRS